MKKSYNLGTIAIQIILVTVSLFVPLTITNQDQTEQRSSNENHRLIKLSAEKVDHIYFPYDQFIMPEVSKDDFLLAIQ